MAAEAYGHAGDTTRELEHLEQYMKFSEPAYETTPSEWQAVRRRIAALKTP